LVPIPEIERGENQGDTLGLKEWLIPQDKMFFGLLEAESAKALEAAKALKELLENFTDIHKKSERVKAIESQGDAIVHDIFEALNRTFVTPIDREDISALAYSLDEVIDHTWSAAIRLCIFKIDKPTKPMLQFADVIVKSMIEINEAVKKLNSMKNADELQRRCVEVNRLENVADEVLHDAMSELFEQTDAIKIIKIKEIYDHLEKATDHCEDVANIINDVVTKYR
jgi:uncharacterized protein Yka (UPF0111/DUF47 family)